MSEDQFSFSGEEGLEVNEQPSPLGPSMSHIFGWTPGANWETSPLPRGEGGPPPAFFSRGGPGEGSVAQQSRLLGSRIERDYN